MSPGTDIGRLVVTCADRPGIVAAISRFLHDAGANIAQSDQYSTDPEGGRFFLRMTFHLRGFTDRVDALREEFTTTVAAPLGLDARIVVADRPKRVAVFASSEDHCLLDLLWRQERGELGDAEIALVVSNHEQTHRHADAFGVPFAWTPIDAATKPHVEATQLGLLRDTGADLVVLARYMQILSPRFLAEARVPIINIHHSFLPAFAGAAPYAQAKARGVKLVGATAHYVTEELDAGPIIEQGVTRVTHRDDVAALVRLGSDIERTVLLRAVQAHCEDRVLIDGATCVVF